MSLAELVDATKMASMDGLVFDAGRAAGAAEKFSIDLLRKPKLRKEEDQNRRWEDATSFLCILVCVNWNNRQGKAMAEAQFASLITIELYKNQRQHRWVISFVPKRIYLLAFASLFVLVIWLKRRSFTRTRTFYISCRTRRCS